MSEHADQGRHHGEDGGSGMTIVPLRPGKMLDLYIENPNGDTQIRTTNRDDVFIRWLKHGRAGSSFSDDDVVVVEEDESKMAVKITLASILGGADFGRSVLKFLEGGLKGNNPFASFTGNRLSFDIMVELPRPRLEMTPGKVRVRTANGDVDLSDVIGSVDIATANGDVMTRNVHGEIALHAANGDLTLERPSGRVTARSVSGDLLLTNGNLSRFTITTVNGDATVETILTGDASRLETVSGDVSLNVTVPASTGVTLTARSISGDADVAAPFRSVAKRTWRLGSGTDDGPSIAVKSVSGDLIARGKLSTDVTKTTDEGILQPPFAPDPPSPTPPAPPVHPSAPTTPISPAFRGKSPVPADGAKGTEADAPDNSPGSTPSGTATAAEDPRLAILRAVERGELDIEEAMRQLDVGK